MGKLENFLLTGTGLLIAGIIGDRITNNFFYLGSITVGIGLFIVLWGVIKYGNI